MEIESVVSNLLRFCFQKESNRITALKTRLRSFPTTIPIDSSIPGCLIGNTNALQGTQLLVDAQANVNLYLIDPPYEVLAVKEGQPFADIRWEQEMWDELIVNVFKTLNKNGHLIVFWQANEVYQRHPDSNLSPHVSLLTMIRSAYNEGLRTKKIPKYDDKGALAHYQLIWNKNTRGMASKCHPHMPHQQFEHIYVFFRKGHSNVKWYEREGLGNVLTFYTEESAKSSLDVVRENSSTQFDMKPQEILRRLVQTYTNLGDTVVDFAMAKGATGEAVLHERRNFIGFEILPKQYRFAQRRLLERAPFGNCKIPRASSSAAPDIDEDMSKGTNMDYGTEECKAAEDDTDAVGAAPAPWGGKRPRGRPPKGMERVEGEWVPKMPRPDAPNPPVRQVDVHPATPDKVQVYQAQGRQTNEIGTDVWKRRCGTPGCFLRDGHDLAHKDMYGEDLI